MSANDFNSAARTLEVGGKSYRYFNLQSLEEQGLGKISKLPFSIKVLLEAAVRQFDGRAITQEHVKQIAGWSEGRDDNKEIPFIPARIVLQDFTGVPVVVDLAAMRDTVKKAGGDPKRINPLVPVDLVIDHSVMVDAFGSPEALEYNMKVEFERNEERYRFLRWAQTAFDNFRAVPPATGIVHQVNLEYLASVAATKTVNGETFVFPDSLVGTDSHTTMINGLGVVGWGVGGIEAEAGMLGQPLYFVAPEVIGFKLTGSLAEGATATDLALTVTQMLRKKGVVGKFVEFYGPGLSNISLADRATVANMAPEYGATIGYFPVDQETLSYLRSTGRSEEQIALVEDYYKAQGMFRTDDTEDPVFTDLIELDLSTVVPSLAGPKRPQDRIELTAMKESFNSIIRTPIDKGGYGLSEDKIGQSVAVKHPDGSTSELKTGAVVIAAITSCTNTSNPSVMVGAGLLAKKAVERGLKKPGYVKSSLTPGSLVVTEYLQKAGLIEPLEALGFHVAGYGCATCIGNSGPLPEEVSAAIADNDMTVAAVLSGNRNFEGRVHAQVKANYLASPPLVVAYALAGTVNIDLQNDPIGYDGNNQPVYLKDIWPSSAEIKEAIAASLSPDMFRRKYEHVFTQNERWNAIPVPQGELYEWDEKSTYIQNPPFFEKIGEGLSDIADIRGASVLALLGDSVTTDHISPAGNISPSSPAGSYLSERGVERKDFNSYGSRRGNHEVMMRGTFANIRIRNQVAPGTEGGVTKYLPEGEVMSIYDASMKYQANGQNLVVIAGKEYGTGSSRDWAAKGTYLLGVKAVIAESFERIHRSNLVGMGVLPLQFQEGTSWKTLGIDGTETFDIAGLSNDVKPGQELTVTATRQDGSTFQFPVIARLDSMVDVDYYHNGGILQTVLRQMIAAGV
ncbi:aconitate hydratase AcnA [Paenibacillus macerans]|uniref:Aconitate hydratase n=1 Tax=Paenibacillus macerans TaxID=44252 RepID=A0A090Z7W0_PAEMA|nr:aconitate hydratase AcnA [Paenibacillus macerans]KFN06453.1 aconitate hydratase 1 [Paenibacillus macerans]MCY7558126.1 aconitate hydratase AcnA [Paenibacillus macerans]MEC0138132.1 aconitate hydratase AcnA [Paenibacillus macerans]MEC0153734.1 aconitate hydratase AcnA [Paenibacillus macerans]MUG25033.1 aconitate hydratase AcnA [Paenibacillus macerans]